MFSFSHQTIHRLVKGKEAQAVNMVRDRLMCYGVWDLYIASDCNENISSISDFGACYNLPVGMKFKSEGAQTYLAGSQNFKVKELEVFQVIYED